MSCCLYSGKLFLEEYAHMENEKRKGNFILNLSTIQKLFLLFLIFHLVSDGNWIGLFDIQGLGFVYESIYLGVNITCVLGFFLFWKPQK